MRETGPTRSRPFGDPITPPDANPFAVFLARYSIEQGGPEAPERFVQEILLVHQTHPITGAPLTPDPWQVDVLREYGAGARRISIRSGHRAGKSAVLAWICVHQALTRLPFRTAITAPTTKQVYDVLWTEIKLWISKCPDFLREVLEIKGERIEHRFDPTSFITATVSRPETPEAIAGVHCEAGWVLLIVDEASGVPEPIYEAASGSMAGNRVTMVLAGNPVRSSGLFYDTHHKLADQWKLHHISCVGHPRVPVDYLTDMARRYGERSNAYRVRVLGEFPLAEQDKVIPFELVESAVDRDVKANPLAPVVWGVDVARHGDDRTALAKRKGNVQLAVTQTWRDLDLMQTATIIQAEYQATPASERPQEILVDAIGMGAGVADRLTQLGLPARGINVSETPVVASNAWGAFLNLRSQLWFNCREWFQKRDCKLLDDTALREEIVRVGFDFSKTGKIQIDSKDKIKQGGFDSPDVADAWVLTFASGTVMSLIGSDGTPLTWNQPLSRNIPWVV